MATALNERKSKDHEHRASALGQFVRNNGLSLVVALLFAVSLGGQVLTGLYDHNEEQADHGQPRIELSEYLASGHFIEATAENWESEFLQMFAYVLLTVFFFQRGSSESK